ncbi:dienelactone hydrolase family protein [Phyllobacterium sp. K27]
MRSFAYALVFLACMLGSGHAASRQQFTVQTDSGGVLVESFGDCANATCPAVVILSGSKGFGAAVYDEIGQTFRAADLNAYLVHVLSADDLDAIATAGSARSRIAYYAQRLPDWISAVGGVAAHFERQPRHGGKIGILGISLGAQIASAASVGRADVDALVLVDGGLPNGYSKPISSLPPLHLIWGSSDQSFSMSIGRELPGTAQQLGVSVALDVYEAARTTFS